MNKDQIDDFGDQTPRRFRIRFLISHPTMDPAEITAQMNMEMHFGHRSGDLVTTPKGAMVGGNYYDTRWGHSIGYEVTDQKFAEEIAKFVDCILPNKSFLARLRETGGTAEVIVSFLGDGHFGDTVSLDTISKLSDLHVELGIEVFSIPQNE